MKTTLSNLLIGGAQELKKNKIPNSQREAALLMQHVLPSKKYPLILDPDTPITTRQEDSFKKMIRRRCFHEPFAYITNQVSFCNEQLFVNKHTLIPRPETEILVKIITNHLKNKKSTDQLSISDIGTGSGAIAIALAKNFPHIKLNAVDNSSRALDVARRNISTHGLTDQINLIKGDLLSPFPDKSLDIIIANLPYIPENISDKIDITVKNFEPLQALFSGIDGLNAITRLIIQLPQKAKPKATIFLEIWPQQKNKIEKLVNEYLTQSKLEFHSDLGGIIRFITIYLDNES